jgi:hypothetical protein
LFLSAASTKTAHQRWSAAAAAAVCLQAIVQSFLGFGLQGLKPEPCGWSWANLQDINQQIHWQVRTS